MAEPGEPISADGWLRRVLTIANQRGLHARAAAKFVKLAGQFDAEVSVAKSDQAASGNSIMGLMMLAAGPGCSIELKTHGRQARQAIDALGRLVENGFDES